jgi:thiol-disulfide isomerase/thioredoxin
MAALMLGAACSDDTPVGPREGQQAPSVEVALLEGGEWSLDVAAGRPAVLVFWASWCGPCRKEAPEVAEVVRSYGDKVAVVSINAGEDPTKARLAAQQWQLTWPVALDPRRKAQTAYEVDALPLVVVLDGAGLVRYRGNGMPSDIHRLLDGLLG